MKSGGGIGGQSPLRGRAELAEQLKLARPPSCRQDHGHGCSRRAKIVLAEGEEPVPKSSGLLAKSLKVRAAQRRKGMARFAVQTAEGFFRGETFYAAFIEFGHKVGSRKLANRKQVLAQPFLKPAFERGADDSGGCHHGSNQARTVRLGQMIRSDLRNYLASSLSIGQRIYPIALPQSCRASLPYLLACHRRPRSQPEIGDRLSHSHL